MEYNSVGWFEIPVSDLDRAQKFYEAVFKIEMAPQPTQENGPQMTWFPMHENKMGATGTLIKGEAYKPSHNGTLIYFTAPDFEETMQRAEENGGKVLVPKTAIGEHGYIAWLEDTEGNRIAIHTTK